MQKKLSLGFTLLELMITVLIAAILLGVAVPSFRTLIANNRVTTVSNEYAAAFRLARSTSLSKGLITFICPSANADTANPNCGVAANWTDGFLVFTKPANAVVAGAGAFNNADRLLLQKAFGDTTSDSVTVGTNNAPGAFLGYLSNGYSWQAAAGGTATPSFVICDAERQEERGRAFSFSVTGRLTIRETDAADAAIPDC